MTAFEQLLLQDVDDLTRLATTSEFAVRMELLRSAARELSHSDLRHRDKLISFIQALAALDEGGIEADVFEQVARALLPVARADEPEDRLGALRALAVLTVNTPRASEEMARASLAIFEAAKNDSSPHVRQFSDEILSAGNAVFRVLASQLPSSVMHEAARAR